jgi:hypothetical protein
VRRSRALGLLALASRNFTARVRFLDVFVRREGRWQAVASHETLAVPR